MTQLSLQMAELDRTARPSRLTISMRTTTGVEAVHAESSIGFDC